MDFRGRKITQDKEASEKYSIEYYESRKGQGISTDNTYINQGSNSGYQAINLAYNLGAKRIILLGYDMQFSGGKAHWFGDHPNNVRSDYNSFISYYKNLSTMLPADLEIINCTKQTALTCFPCKELNICI